MEKLKDLLIIILFVLSIVFFIFAIIKKPVENLSRNDKLDIKEDEGSYTSSVSNPTLDTVLIDNMNSLFSKYNGELTRLEVSKFIRNIALTELYDLKNVENSEEYFNNNLEKIKFKYGITQYNVFVNLYNYVKDYEINVKAISIISESVKVENDTTSFKIKVVFENEAEKEFNCLINNIVSSNSPNIIFYK